MIEVRLSSVLDKQHIAALRTGAMVLLDELLDDLHLLKEGEDFSETSMYIYLPAKNLPRYSARFARKFVTCVSIVAWKLFSTKKRERLSCVAEELALNAIIKHAEFQLEMNGIQPDFGVFYDTAFQDLDFEMMFKPEWDGIDEDPRFEEMGFTSLRFEDWFVAFSNTGSVHPFVQESELSFDSGPEEIG